MNFQFSNETKKTEMKQNFNEQVTSYLNSKILMRFKEELS